MTIRKYYIGSVGPFYYDDADPINDPDGDFPGEDFHGFITDGPVSSTYTAVNADEFVRLADLLDAIALFGSITGTANQIIVTDDGDGTITLSLPQNIDTSADVIFDTLTIDKTIFSTSAGLVPSEGEVCWNSVDGTLNVGLPGGTVILQVGQELLTPKAKAVGSNISNGDLVYVSGGSGANPEMTLAKADALSTAKSTIAMATEDITQNDFGYYTALGLVREVDTSAYSAGDQLYLSAATAGAYTGTAPTRPNFQVKIGIVIRSHATEGVIYVGIRERSLMCLQQDNEKILFGAGSDVSMHYDGTDFHFLTAEVAASDLKLDCGTNKTLELQSSVYEDLQVSISNIRIPTSNAPTERLYDGGTGGVTFPFLGFAVNDYIYFEVQTSHTMKLNTIIDNHIHFTLPNTTNIGDNFQFQLDVMVASWNVPWAVPTGSPFTAEHIVAANDNTYHRILEMADIPASNSTVSTIYKCKLTRIAATADEYGSEVYITFTDCHYQKNTLGSRQENIK